MSSKHSSTIFGASYCIDGILKRRTSTLIDSMCHINSKAPMAPAPWLAIHLQEESTVHSVILFNREDCCGERTSNVEVRLTNHLEPVSDASMYTGGQLLGRFAGPASAGQVIHITGATPATGKYVIIQMDKITTPSEAILNLLEVKVVGNYQGKQK